MGLRVPVAPDEAHELLEASAGVIAHPDSLLVARFGTPSTASVHLDREQSRPLGSVRDGHLGHEDMRGHADVPAPCQLVERALEDRARPELLWMTVVLLRRPVFGLTGELFSREDDHSSAIARGCDEALARGVLLCAHCFSSPWTAVRAFAHVTSTWRCTTLTRMPIMSSEQAGV